MWDSLGHLWTVLFRSNNVENLLNSHDKKRGPLRGRPKVNEEERLDQQETIRL